MCGICGHIRFDGSAASVAAVRRMTDTMSSRGPDAEGALWQGRVALGHRRLKIIDLSESAQQPMVDPDLGLAIVYNGAIYNYRELREELVAKGYRFYSSGDTEVLLKAYHAWGKLFVQRLNGMFAFAILERDSGRVLLARDRLGIKPLYYSVNEEGMVFASSLAAVLAARPTDTTIDPVALHYYMTFHSVVPPPHTILSGVRKLAPGIILTVEPDGRRQSEMYWSLRFGRDPRRAKYTEADWEEELAAELQAAVRRRLVADVPVGVLLSGGLDSSLVVALLAAERRDGIATFSIGFESVAGEKGDEFEFSDVVAERFATDHHRIRVDSERVLPAMERCVRSMNEPMVSHDCIGFYLLSEEVARHVKVVESGQGADEVFAGYYWYPPFLDTDDPVATYRREFFDRPHEEFAMQVEPRFVHEDFSGRLVEEMFAQEPDAPAIDRALRLDTTIMLIDDPVKRVDSMTMAWGLEARVPFLDHELVEFAAQIPGELKVRDEGKYILKRLARRMLPAEVIDRPKGYFPVPALKYLRGAYLDFVRDVLHQDAARARRLFNRDYTETLLSDPESHITPLRGSKLWQIALLEYWLQLHDA
ncbi:MAG: N-acetylglutaminylglutamine amidotransferase [Candidatus Krumholzibacteria bacterium]|nr:N-acetylglutaminylglutamine amidotransferase [Candidatus Krumholzibacteria bacterium]